MTSATQGRRGYYLYQYGKHLWFPQTQTDFSAGMFQDVPRHDIPLNGVRDSLDFILSTPGLAKKRGSAIAMSLNVATSLLGTVSYLTAIARYPNTSIAFSKSVGITDLGHFIGDLEAGTPKATAACVVTRDTPKMWIGGTNNLMIITSQGTSVPYYFDGANPPRPLGATTQHLAITGTPTGGTITVTGIKTDTFGVFSSSATASVAFNASSATVVTQLNGMGLGTFTATGGALPGTAVEITPPTGVTVFLATGYNSLTGGSSPAAAITWTGSASNCPSAWYSTMHLSRVVLARTTANPNRIYFSPVTDPTAAWDATAYVDANYPVTGLAVLGGALLVFSQGSLEKFVGDTPPPGSNFTHLTVDEIGCADARSITVSNGVCIFANASGVYQTNGVTVESLTDGRIGGYWRSLFGSSYSPSTWSIATGVWARRYLYVTVLDDTRALAGGLMCDLTTRAWWRVSAPATMMYAPDRGRKSATANVPDTLLAASAAAGYGLDVGRFVMKPGEFGGTVDTDTLTTIAPLLETRPFGGFPSVYAFGRGHLSYDLHDPTSADPTLAVTVATGINAASYSAVAESPLAETTAVTRTRFSTGKARGSQALSLKIQQTNASSLTEVYGIEIDTRGFPREAGGQ